MECFDFKQNFKPSFSGLSCYLSFLLPLCRSLFFFLMKNSFLFQFSFCTKKTPFFSSHEASFSSCCPYCKYFKFQVVIYHSTFTAIPLFLICVWCNPCQPIAYSTFPFSLMVSKATLSHVLVAKTTAKFVTDFLSVSSPYTSSLKIRRHVVLFSSFSVLGSPFPLESKPNRNEGF